MMKRWGTWGAFAVTDAAGIAEKLAMKKNIVA